MHFVTWRSVSFFACSLFAGVSRWSSALQTLRRVRYPRALVPRPRRARTWLSGVPKKRSSDTLRVLECARERDADPRRGRQPAQHSVVYPHLHRTRSCAGFLALPGVMCVWRAAARAAGAAAGSTWPENEASLPEASGDRGGAGVAGSAGLPAGPEPEEAAGARKRSGERRRRRWRDGVQPGEVHLGVYAAFTWGGVFAQIGVLMTDWHLSEFDSDAGLMWRIV